MLMENNRSSYSEILKNKKLIKEMKKVLQILPFGVVISSAKKNQEWFTNQEFTNKFAKIRKDLDELSDIDISFINPRDEVNISKEFPTNLSQVLKLQREKLDNNDVMVDDLMVEEDVKIFCNPNNGNQLVNESEETLQERICNIKTLTVEWEGVDSYMHVFIDNTNVIKLEEAKNNIKCQKIMFTSASHEFRTPLNSITNSFDIILDSF